MFRSCDSYVTMSDDIIPLPLHFKFSSTSRTTSTDTINRRLLPLGPWTATALTMFILIRVALIFPMVPGDEPSLTFLDFCCLVRVCLLPFASFTDDSLILRLLEYPNIFHSSLIQATDLPWQFPDLPEPFTQKYWRAPCYNPWGEATIAIRYKAW